MAGGRATRFEASVEKALLVVGGRSLLSRSIDALRVDGIDDVVVAVSPHTPETSAEAIRLGLAVIDTSGAGYHEDVMELLTERDLFLTVNVDVPFIRREHVAELLGRFDGGSLAGVVPEGNACLEPDEASTSEDGTSRVIWIGLNIVTPQPITATALFGDPLLTVNVNDQESLRLANDIAVQRGI